MSQHNTNTKVKLPKFIDYGLCGLQKELDVKICKVWPDKKLQRLNRNQQPLLKENKKRVL